MRASGFLVLVLIVIFTTHYIFQNRKLNRLLSESSQMMLADVPGAIETFKPALKIKDLDTFGKSSATQRTWFSNLTRAAIELSNKPSFTDQDGRNIAAALGAIGKAEVMTPQERLGAQEQILERLKAAPGTLSTEGFLGDFDAFVRFVESLEKGTDADVKFMPEIALILEEARKIDRYPIALRTVEFEAAQAMKAGFDYLGIPLPAGPGVVRIPPQARIASWNPGPAEASFHRTRIIVEKFLADWPANPAPPNVSRMIPVAQFNSAMTRFAYSVLSMRTSADGKWKMYFLPDVPPGEADEFTHRSNYLVGMSQGFSGASQTANRLAPNDPCHAAIMQTVPAVLNALGKFSSSGMGGPAGMLLFFLY